MNEITKLKDEPEEEKANRRKIESTEDVCVLCVGLVIDGEVLAGDVGTRQLERRDGGFAGIPTHRFVLTVVLTGEVAEY